MSEVRAAALADLAPARPVAVTLNGTRVALVRVGEQVHALADTCVHQGGPLSEGRVSGTRLACPWHGWMYDVRTGQCLMPARGGAVPSYPVRVEGGDVWVDVP
ncbi:MAG TPA: Rieske (2Fe-2S) protein [Methylomirabilota bacterium]|nr:Rieske (2Fe-2S) protein [Methylomirabilota bacterium]